MFGQPTFGMCQPPWRGSYDGVPPKRLDASYPDIIFTAKIPLILHSVHRSVEEDTEIWCSLGRDYERMQKDHETMEALEADPDGILRMLKVFLHMEYAFPMVGQPREEWFKVVSAFGTPRLGTIDGIVRVVRALRLQYDFIAPHPPLQSMSDHILDLMSSLLQQYTRVSKVVPFGSTGENVGKLIRALLQSAPTTPSESHIHKQYEFYLKFEQPGAVTLLSLWPVVFLHSFIVQGSVPEALTQLLQIIDQEQARFTLY